MILPSVGFYIHGTGTQHLYTAVYADSGGSPNIRLAVSNSTVIPGLGFQTPPFLKPICVTAHTKIWPAYVVDATGLDVEGYTAVSLVGKRRDLGSYIQPPNPFGAVGSTSSLFHNHILKYWPIDTNMLGVRHLLSVNQNPKPFVFST